MQPSETTFSLEKLFPKSILSDLVHAKGKNKQTKLRVLVKRMESIVILLDT